MGLLVQPANTLSELAALAAPETENGPELAIIGLAPYSDTEPTRGILKRLTERESLGTAILCNATEPPSVIADLATRSTVVVPKATGHRALAQTLKVLVSRDDKTPQRQTPAPVREATRRLGQGRLILLVVDDNPINLKLNKALLESCDVQVLEATNGEQAVYSHRNFAPDMILMDIQMPGMSGLEATRRIRRYEADGPHTPLIAVTAHAYAEARDQFMSAGIDDCITKPLDPEQLYRLIDDWTRSKGSAQPSIDPGQEHSEVIIHDRAAALQATGGNTRVAADLWKNFLELLPDYQLQLKRALIEKDYLKMQEQAHRIMGSAAICCTPKLKLAASALERAICGHRESELEALVEEVERQLMRLGNLGRNGMDPFSRENIG
jgi:two-component system sensor histidine kinase BarA